MLCIGGEPRRRRARRARKGPRESVVVFSGGVMELGVGEFGTILSGFLMAM